MIVVTRYRVDLRESDAFATEAARAIDALAARVGYLDGTIGRNVDDPALWTITLRWRDVGSYRRALSNADVKVSAVPLLSRAIDEPTAYEIIGRRAADD